MSRQRLNTWPENDPGGLSELPRSPSRTSKDSALSEDSDVPLLLRTTRVEPSITSTAATAAPSGCDVTTVCRVAPLLVDVIFVGVTTAAYMTD